MPKEYKWLLLDVFAATHPTFDCNELQHATLDVGTCQGPRTQCNTKQSVHVDSSKFGCTITLPHVSEEPPHLNLRSWPHIFNTNTHSQHSQDRPHMITTYKCTATYLCCAPSAVSPAKCLLVEYSQIPVPPPLTHPGRDGEIWSRIPSWCVRACP